MARLSSGPARQAVFRADASARIGGGHLARCLALAQALEADGWQCAFSVNDEAISLVPAVKAYPVMPPLEAVAGELPTCDLLVVDHYGLDAVWESACRASAKRILSFDDAPTRRHDCDILIDSAPERTTESYADVVPGSCLCLLGPDYAPLVPEFAHYRRTALGDPKSDETIRVFVNFGMSAGVEPYLWALEAIAHLAAATNLAIEADVVLGAMPGEAAERVRGQALAIGAGVRVRGVATDLAASLVRAHVAMGGGGVSSLERCCLGVPAIIVVQTENQETNARLLAQRGAAIDLGPLAKLDARKLSAALTNLTLDAGRRRAMSRRAATICDGRGAARIASRIAPPCARDGDEVSLRTAKWDDAAVMLEWQSDPRTRRWSRNSRAPDRAGHEAWLRDKLDDPNCSLMMIVHGDEPAGVLRLDRRAGDAEVSILIDSSKQGRGIAAAALRIAHFIFADESFIAAVHPENSASTALFRRCGYRRDGEWLRYMPSVGTSSTRQPVLHSC